MFSGDAAETVTTCRVATVQRLSCGMLLFPQQCLIFYWSYLVHYFFVLFYHLTEPVLRNEKNYWVFFLDYEDNICMCTLGVKRISWSVAVIFFKMKWFPCLPRCCNRFWSDQCADSAVWTYRQWDLHWGTTSTTARQYKLHSRWHSGRPQEKVHVQYYTILQAAAVPSPASIAWLRYICILQLPYEKCD